MATEIFGKLHNADKNDVIQVAGTGAVVLAREVEQTVVVDTSAAADFALPLAPQDGDKIEVTEKVATDIGQPLGGDLEILRQSGTTKIMGIVDDVKLDKGFEGFELTYDASDDNWVN